MSGLPETELARAFIEHIARVGESGYSNELVLNGETCYRNRHEQFAIACHAAASLLIAAKFTLPARTSSTATRHGLKNDEGTSAGTPA